VCVAAARYECVRSEGIVYTSPREYS